MYEIVLMLKQKICQVFLDILFPLWFLFYLFFRPFFMHAVYPRKTTLPNIPVRQAVGFLVK